MNLVNLLQELGVEPIVGEHFLAMGEGELHEIEQRLGTRFPEAYRQLLLTYGSIGFLHTICFRPIRPLPSYLSDTGESEVDLLYGPASKECETYSLDWAITAYRGRMPENLIPIGGDLFGNQICLGVRGAELGQIYYWDHDREYDEEVYRAQGWPTPLNPLFWNVHLIAESFDDFLTRLYVYEHGE